MKEKKNNPKYDLYAEVTQSASDKVVSSVSYPFTVFEQKQPFPGCTKLAASMADAPFYALTKKEMEELLAESVRIVTDRKKASEVTVYDEVFAFGGSIIQQAKHVLDAANTLGKDYESPEPKELKRIVDEGIQGLVGTLGGDWGLYAWCPYLRVTVQKQPHIGLTSPRIDLSGIEVEVTATGELWAKYPWPDCYKWCIKWVGVIKCERIASLPPVSPKLKAEAHADLRASGASVIAQGRFDKLRLDYPILDKIPLEGIANRALADKLVFVYDASKLVATVPLLQSHFTVDSLTLPPSEDGINVGITLRQVKLASP